MRLLLLSETRRMPTPLAMLIAFLALPIAGTLATDSGEITLVGETWVQLTTHRRKAVDEHLSANASGWRWFAEASHGEQAGAPFVFFSLLPRLAPDIWGPPSERFASFGFYSVPNEMYHTPEQHPRPHPLGLGWVTNPVEGEGERATARVRFVSLTCAACHVGRVRDHRGGEQILIGAPNVEIDVRKYRRAFELTVDRLLMDAEIHQTITRIQELIREIVADDGPEAFYGGWYGIDAEAESEELAIYLDDEQCRSILEAFARKVGLGRLAIEKQLATSYSLPNAPPLDGGTPGQSDGSGDLIPKLLLYREVMAARTRFVEVIICR